jgi:hypothetical protein
MARRKMVKVPASKAGKKAREKEEKKKGKR